MVLTHFNLELTKIFVPPCMELVPYHILVGMLRCYDPFVPISNNFRKCQLSVWSRSFSIQLASRRYLRSKLVATEFRGLGKIAVTRAVGNLRKHSHLVEYPYCA